jgi:hypothetical protein
VHATLDWVVNPTPDTEQYVSPRAVTSLPPRPDLPLRAEITLLFGNGYRFSSIAAAHRRLVHTFQPADTLSDVLRVTITSFDPPACGDLGEFRIRPDFQAARGDELSWPEGRHDMVWCITPCNYCLEECDCLEELELSAGWDFTVASVLGQGDVGYVRFDYGDEWWWRVRVVEVGESVPGDTVLPALSITVPAHE